MTDLPSFTPSPPDRDVTAVMGRRILAWVIDLLLFIGVAAGMFAALAEYTEIPAGYPLDACTELTDTAAADPDIENIGACVEIDDRAYTTSEADAAIQSGVSFAYLVVFIVLQGVAGGSPGKLVTGLRVVTDDGTKAGVGRSFVRTLLWIVDGAPWFAPLVGFIVGLTTTGHRRVGDFVAKTYVIARKDMGTPVRTGAAATPPPDQPAWGAPPAATPPPPMGAGPWDAPSSPPPPSPQPAPPAPEPPTPTAPAAPPAPAPPISDDALAGPPPLPTAGYDQPRSWEEPVLDEPMPAAEAPPPAAPEPPAEATAPSDEADVPTFEAATPADEPPPTIGADPSWYAGPEAEPSVAAEPEPTATDDVPPTAPPVLEPEVPAPDTSEPETWTPTDPATEWSPPTTPTSEPDTPADPPVVEPPAAEPPAAEEPAPEEPTGFVAPGSTPSAPATPRSTSLPRMGSVSEPQAPPPQWDEARNTYIQWDPRQGAWLQWDTAANRWKPIDT